MRRLHDEDDDGVPLKDKPSYWLRLALMWLVVVGVPSYLAGNRSFLYGALGLAAWALAAAALAHWRSRR